MEGEVALGKEDQFSSGAQSCRFVTPCIHTLHQKEEKTQLKAQGTPATGHSTWLGVAVDPWQGPSWL